MFKQLLGFELRLQAKQFSFWIACFIMFAVGFLAMSVDWFSISIEGGERAKQNGANPLALSIGFLSLGAIFFSSVYVVTGMMRDDVHKFTEFMHSSPVKNSELVVPRMMGAFLATFLSVFAAVIGMFLGQFAPWIDKEVLGPINLWYFLFPTLVFLTVNALFFTAFFAMIAGLTRNKMLIYVSAVGLLALYFASSLLVQDAPEWLASITDPLGLNALGLETQYWPADEQNRKTASLAGNLGINRLFWGGLSLAMLAGTFKMFRRGLFERKSKKSKTGGTDMAAASYSPVTPSFGTSASLAAFWARIKLDYLSTVKSISFYVLCGIALFLMMIVLLTEIFFVPDPTLPTSGRMARMSVGGFAFPTLLVIIFFSGDIIWRERTAKINEITDSSPVLNWHLLLSKWVALCLTVITMFVFAGIVGIVMQMMLGSFDINLGTYFSIIFISFIPRFLILAGLALFVQNFMPHRIIGMFAAAAVLMFFQIFVSQIPFYHPLMGLGSMGTGSFSELNGFESLVNFKWFGLYNVMIVGLLAVLSTWLWRRGLQSSLIRRVKAIGSRVSPASLGLAGVFAAGSIFTGLHIAGAYDRVEWRNSKAQEKRSVAYENMFKDIYKREVPKIRSVEVEADISPSRREGLFSGHYIVENTTSKPLRDLFVNLPTRHAEDIKKLEVEGAVQDTQYENYESVVEYGYQVFKFTEPVAQGDFFRIDFSTYFHPPKLADGSVIRRNGTFVNNFQVMPYLEIEDNWLQNPDKRRKYDLPELPKKPDQTNETARQNNFVTKSADYVDFKARVCTDPGQIPIAPGHMIEQQDLQKDGFDRHCRTYEAINPILNFFSFLTADYTVKRDQWNNPNGKDVDLAIYYHKPHDYNVDLMLQASKDSLDSFTTLFGPYQYNQIRIMEFPHASFAQAFAGTVPFSESIGFVRDPGDPEDPKSIDLASYVTMHEIGHQWFAHQIVPADTKGFNVLSEGLTENAAMTAYEDAFGWTKARRVLEKRAIESYLANRVLDRDDEPALINAANQQYIIYNKASWVFWGLKQQMGEEVMQNAIRSFLDEYGSKGPPYPTTYQLVEHLRSAASDDYQQLITDYWERITFWELGLDDVEMSETGGQYSVSLTAKVDKKIATEESGKETSVTKIDDEELNEWVEIGFYDQDPKETLGADWIKLERVRVTELETPMTFTMDKKPSHVLIDPKRLLIERNVTDNVKRIDAGGEG